MRVLCPVEMVGALWGIKTLLLACNGIAFKGQTQCFFRAIALLLQSKRNEVMGGCFGVREKKEREWGGKCLRVLGKG